MAIVLPPTAADTAPRAPQLVAQTQPTAPVKLTPARPLVACAACKKGLPQERFAVRATTGARRKVCDACLESVAALLRGGAHTVEAIASATRVSRTTVIGVRKDLGMPGRHERLTATQRSAAIALSQSQTGDADPDWIAQQIGAKPLTVRRLLRKEQIISPSTSNRPISEKRLARARLLLEDGAPYREVARTTRIGVKTLVRHFPDMGADRSNRALLAWINKRPDIRDLYLELNRGLPKVA